MTDLFSPTPPQSALLAEICRCSSHEEHAARARTADSGRITREDLVRAAEANQRAAALAARSPDPGNYIVERVHRAGNHLVMQVRYPSCKECTYEGLKTMVFLDVSEATALRWRRIDPHFRGKTTDPTQAPSPAARFPGSNDGWADAIAYATGKTR